MEWLDRVSAKKGVVGIEILPDGLAIAAKGCLGKPDEIDLLTVISDRSAEIDLQKELDHCVDKHRINKRLCHLVLHPKDYQLLLVESPNVPDADLREAVRWKIKDLISMPPDQAAIEVFHLPSDANKTSKKMIYVVVANLERVKELVELVNQSGLTLSSIDIGELAMRNMSWVVGEQMHERGIGIARISEGNGVVSLYKNGNLYLSRQFKLDYRAGLLDDLPVDALALEIQRSLDYYERQMGLSPPAALYLCGESVSADKITQELVRSINVPLQLLDPSNNLNFVGEVDDGMLQLCMGALGGAHREQVLQ